jgi:hypothetical protein
MEPVVLRHTRSGAFFGWLSDGPSAVRFESVAAAAAFRGRFLDEPLAWEALPLAVLDAADRAA